MDWVKSHYAEQSKHFGKAIIRDQHRTIAAGLHGLCRQIDGCRRVLELGAGAGGLAAAMAELGYEVYAVEFNPTDIALARELAASLQLENLHIVEDDFYRVSFTEKFDLIYYWDGFGVGDDADQKRLLTRIGTEWLTDHGMAIIDVFSPWNWQRRSGEVATFTANDGRKWTRVIRFDALNSRFRDQLQCSDEAQATLSQTLRLYSLQEFLMLCAGTGTSVAEFYTDFAERVGPGDFNADLNEALMNRNGYFAQLVKAG